MAGIGMTSCSTNGSGQRGAATNESTKGYAKFSAMTDSTLRIASEKMQFAIEDHDLSAFASELQKIPKICSTLSKGLIATLPCSGAPIAPLQAFKES